jgi:NADH-quinone oxidoreductase subunit K
MLKILLLKKVKILNILFETQNSKEQILDLYFFLVEKNQTMNVYPWTAYLFLFYLLFWIGLLGMIFNNKNYLMTMFCIELMYLGITICFIIIAIYTGDPKGQIYALLLLVLAAAESAIGLGILIVLYRFGKSIDFQNYQELKDSSNSSKQKLKN